MIAGAGGEDHKIFVLADKDTLLGDAASPDGKIIRAVQTTFEHVETVEAPASQIGRESQGELIVDPEFHLD
jgi:hypothetical protein